MSRLLSFCLLVFCAFVLIALRVTNLSATVLPTSPQLTDSAVRTVEIQDPVFRMTAYRTPVPQSWAFDGVLLRDPACGTAAGVAYRATSPDGLTAEQQLPTIGWHYSDDPANVQVFRKWNCKSCCP